MNNTKVTYNVPIREGNKNGHRLDVYHEVPKIYWKIGNMKFCNCERKYDQILK